MPLFVVTFAKDEPEKRNKPWKSFYSKKNYSSSINDSVRLVSSMLNAGPTASVNAAASDPSCYLQDRGDEYLFVSKRTGLFQVYFSSRSRGSLDADTVTILVSDSFPMLKLNQKEISAGINEPVVLDASIHDDGEDCRVALKLSNSITLLPVDSGLSDLRFRFSRPTQNGTREETFTGVLFATDNDGHQVFDTLSFTVLYYPPRADAGSSLIACLEEPVTLSAKKSRDSNGPIKQYLWDFDGDGRVDTAVNQPEVEHVFTQTGDVEAVLRVMDGDGNLSLPATVMISVYRPKPQASIIALHEGRQNVEMSFVGTGKTGCGEIEKFVWDFNGDGKWDFQSRTHGRTAYTYLLPGTYFARFRIFNTKGDSSEVIWPVKILP